MASPPSEPLQPAAVAPDPDKKAETPPKPIPASSSSPSASSSSALKQTNDDPAENFGDHSSSYWPSGWNFSRYTRATGLELHSLPDDQYPKLQAGLLDVLGEDGMDRLNDYLHKLARQRAGIQTSYPDWLKYLRDYHADQAWGFVAIQTACFDDQQRWADFKAKLNEIVWAATSHATSAAWASDLTEAKAKFEIRWIEDPTMALDQDGQGPGLDGLRERFKQAIAVEDCLPDAISKEVFLIASEDAIASVMGASVPAITRFHDPDTAESTKAKRRGPDGIIDPPYILAVAADEPPQLDEDEDGHGWFKPVFRVAAELLATDFWHELDFQTNRNGEPLMKLTRCTRGVDLRGRALEESEGGGKAEDQDVWWGTLVPHSRRAKRGRVM